MITELLSTFGLTANEAVIYNFLVENGITTVSDLARNTKVSRSSLYSCLASLSEKSLVVFNNEEMSWGALEFDEYADNLASNLKFLRSKFNLLPYKIDLLNLKLVNGVSRNKLLLLSLIKEHKYNDIHIVSKFNSSLLQIISKCNLSNLTLITDNNVELKFRNIICLKFAKIYEKFDFILLDDFLCIFIDNFRYSLQVKDRNLIEFIKDNYIYRN